MLTLEALNLRWLSPTPDDLCAHGDVVLTIDGASFAGGPGDDDSRDITVSAAGLHLLRSLETDHHAGSDEPLFPCCGDTLGIDADGVYIMGCPNGADISVSRTGDVVTLGRAGLVATVTQSEWQEAVLAFTDQVQAFYDASPARSLPMPWQRNAWSLFWHEWVARRLSARSGASTPR